MSDASIGYTQSAKSAAELADTQPHVKVVEIWDPTIAEDEIDALKQNLVQLHSEPLRARRILVRLKECVLLYHSTNLAIRSHAKLEAGLIGFVVLGTQSAGILNGLPIRPHLIAMAAPGLEARFVVDRGYEDVAIGIPQKELESHFVARGQPDLLKGRSALELLVCDPTKTRALFTLGKRLATTAAQQPQLFNESNQVRAAADVEILEMLLEALCSSDNYTVTRSDMTQQAYSRVVRIVEEYVLTHNDIQLYVTDLCKAAAVSQRTLEYAFKEILGMSPVAYLQRLRLHRVRQALRVGTRATTTVSREALKWGFWHFGDFAKSYRTCFGESPSETLRRGQDQI
jgi:AraC family transcriptional regulator, ethanolamine operon transcriptional activator